MASSLPGSPQPFSSTSLPGSQLEIVTTNPLPESSRPSASPSPAPGSAEAPSAPSASASTGASPSAPGGGDPQQQQPGPGGLSSRFGGEFFDYFSLELAHTDEMARESFRLRHRVYVEEMKFERAEDFPCGMEHDSYDSHSLTMLLRHNATAKTIGCVRLIVANPAEPAKPFPFEGAAGATVSQHPVFRGTARNRLGEVSRLAIAPEFRRRRNDQEMGLYAVADAVSNEQDPRRRNNLPPALGLVFAGALLGMEIGLQAVFVMMELRLARMLRSMGFQFEQVSEAIEYHGLRAPFVITREAMEGDIPAQLRSALALVRERALALAQLDTPLLQAIRSVQVAEPGTGRALP
jgi:N-acyl amino acid synthase of PEP-CTERM/exosortase system